MNDTITEPTYRLADGTTVHRVARGTYRVGGFTRAWDAYEGVRFGSVRREEPPMGHEIRLHVLGHQGVGFGLGAVDADLHYNLGPRQPTTPGPHVYAFGLAACIDNFGGTGREIQQARDAGLLIEARIGDCLEVDGRLWRIEWNRQGTWVDHHNITLHLVGDAPAQEDSDDEEQAQDSAAPSGAAQQGRTLIMKLPPHQARQLMDDIDRHGNDASLASKRLWGHLNTLFGFDLEANRP